MPELALESLARRLEEVERRLNEKQPSVIAPAKDWRSVVGNEAVRRNPNSAEVYWRRAGAWHARERFAFAFRDYDEAIRLDPTNSVYFDDRGFANGNGFQQVSVVVRTEFDG